MTHIYRSKRGMPLQIRDTLVRIGERVRLARTRRDLTQVDMAGRMFVTRKTLSRLEKGDPGVSLAVLASALWVLGLDAGLEGIADPDRDVVGLRREQQRNPRRVRRSIPDVDLNF